MAESLEERVVSRVARVEVAVGGEAVEEDKMVETKGTEVDHSGALAATEEVVETEVARPVLVMEGASGLEVALVGPVAVEGDWEAATLARAGSEATQGASGATEAAKEVREVVESSRLVEQEAAGTEVGTEAEAEMARAAEAETAQGWAETEEEVSDLCPT